MAPRLFIFLDSGVLLRIICAADPLAVLGELSLLLGYQRLREDAEPQRSF